MIRAERPGAFDKDEEIVAVRMIHAAGMVGLSELIEFSAGFAGLPARLLKVAHQFMRCADGVRRYHARLPADNIICNSFIQCMRAFRDNNRLRRSRIWRPHLAGAVVAIGNAPTALFHL